MAVSPIVMNGMLPASQDISIIKQADDSKAAIMQGNTEVRAERQAEEKVSTVREGDNVENNMKGFDAKEKGDNEYEGDGGMRRKKENQGFDGKVVIKNKGGFDITI